VVANAQKARSESAAMLVGYAFPSAGAESAARQRALLSAEGCRLVVTEGRDSRRPRLRRLVDELDADDVLVVSRLEDLGSGTSDIVLVMERVRGQSAHLRSLDQAIDTTGTHGPLLFRLLAAFAQTERRQRGERARGALHIARARGQQLGRPPKLSPVQVASAESRVAAGESVASVARSFEVSALTLRRALQAERRRVWLQSERQSA